MTMNNINENKLFLVLSVVTMPPMFIYYFLLSFLGYGQDMHYDNIVMFVLMIVCAVLTWAGVKFNKKKIVAPIIAMLQVLIIIPETAAYAEFGMGTTIWFAAGVLYVVIMIEGWLRYLILIMEAIMAASVHQYYYDLSPAKGSYSLADYYIAYCAVLTVSVMIIIMVGYEIKLLKEVNRKAQEQRKEIEELNRAQNRFFSSMSHEIRTPINTIIGLNEMILREDVSDEVVEDAKNIQSASKMLLSLINDILDMSKIESGKMDIVRAPYDVGKMLSELVNMIWMRAEQKGLKFSIDVDPNLPAQLFSDEIRIKQILINLLNNAVKYTQEGEVSLSINCRKTDQTKVLVTYSVEDTGIGIKKESIPYLFDAFRREDEKQNRFIEGTGLGLSIVKQLVNLLGGEISVNSVYTKGSTFIVSIEQEIVEEKTIGKFEPERTHTSSNVEHYHQSFEAPGAKILVVDDDSANLMVVTKLLRDTKVQIDTAMSGMECLQLTEDKRYDVIFMDHMMPKMDGIECFHALREQTGGLCKDTPVYVFTANAGSENQALYMREGFDGYILKPVEARMLEETLLSILPKDIVKIQRETGSKYETERIVRDIKRTIPLLITTDSVADLPQSLVTGLKIPVFPYRVHMDGGVFADKLEVSGDVMIRYIEDKKTDARSEAPEPADYEGFFAEQLSHAQHIIHIALAKNASKGYAHATEAARSFYNVKVYDSGHLSSGMGLVALAAREMASSGQFDTDVITAELDKKKNKINTTFIVDSTEYLHRSGRLPEWVYKMCTALMVHPVLVMKKSEMRVGTIIVGSRERVWKRYIRRTFVNSSDIDTSVLFITYAGLTRTQVEEIAQEVSTYVNFEKVYFQKASPAISINCGPGTFGLIFSRK